MKRTSTIMAAHALSMALAGTALHNPTILRSDPGIAPRTKRPLTSEQEAVYLANKAEIDAELERRHHERVMAKQTAAFEKLNAAEIKRERKRAKARKDHGYETR